MPSMRLLHYSLALAMTALLGGLLAAEVRAATVSVPVSGASTASASAAPVAAAAPAIPAGSTVPPLLPPPIPGLREHLRVDRAVRVVLDIGQPQPARLTALASLRQAARVGDGEAQFVLGSMYMWGPRHPATLLPKDLAKAQIYLSHAATQGWLQAMAAMAEINLQLGHPKTATVWALADYSFSGARHYTREGYLADLLHRCLRALPVAEQKRALTDANGFIARYRNDVLAGRAMAGPVDSCPLQMRSARRRRVPQTLGNVMVFSREVPRSGDAMFLLAVDRSGHVRQLLPVSAFPSWQVMRILQPLARDTRFNAALGCSTPLRWTMAPFDFGNGHYRLNR